MNFMVFFYGLVARTTEQHGLNGILFSIHNNNNLYCAPDTKSVKTLKGNNCEKREHSHSEIAKANRAEWLGHAEK